MSLQMCMTMEQRRDVPALEVHRKEQNKEGSSPQMAGSTRVPG